MCHIVFLRNKKKIVPVRYRYDHHRPNYIFNLWLVDHVDTESRDVQISYSSQFPLFPPLGFLLVSFTDTGGFSVINPLLISALILLCLRTILHYVNFSKYLGIYFRA